eukprot:scaffold179589_cov30-Tisochrysis_lutea.AAC.2
MTRKSESAFLATPSLSDKVPWAKSGGSIGTEPPLREGSIASRDFRSLPSAVKSCDSLAAP